VAAYGVLPELGTVQVTARTHHTLTLTWTPPVLHGAALKSVAVYCGRQHLRTVAPPDQTHVRLTGLAPGTLYTLTLVAVTSAATLTSPALHARTRAEDDLRGLSVALSLFSAAEEAELQSLVAQLGGTWTDKFTPANTHLVCKAPTGTRYAQACAWNIPAVGPDWLRACVATGRLPPVRQHHADHQAVTAYFPTSARPTTSA
jgi:hypothetical protein